MRKWLFRGPWLAILVALLAHTRGLWNRFTFDDFADIVTHPVVNGSKSLSSLFFYNFMGQPLGTGHPTLRPFTSFVFALEWRLWGRQPFYFHLLSLLLFLLLLWLVYRTFRLFLHDATATIGTTLFAGLAINVSSIAAVAHRAELLALIFALLAFHAVAKRRIGLACVLYLLALCSKESSIVFPGLLLCYGMSHQQRAFFTRQDPWMRGLLATTLTGFAFLALRLWWLPLQVKTFVALGDNPLLQSDWPTRLWTPFVLLGTYLQRFFVPTGFTADYTYLVVPVDTDLSQPAGWLGVVFALALCGLLGLGLHRVSLAFRKDKDESTTSTDAGLADTTTSSIVESPVATGALTHQSPSLLPVLVFAGGAFMVQYSLISNTFFRFTVIMAERLFLGPALWLCLLLVALGSLIQTFSPRLKPLLLVFVGLFLLLQVPAAMLRTKDWKDNKTLWYAMIREYPRNSKAHEYLAQTLKDQEYYVAAIWHLACSIYAQRHFKAGFRGAKYRKTLELLPSPPRHKRWTWQYPFDYKKARKLPFQKRYHHIPTMIHPKLPPARAIRLFHNIVQLELGAEAARIVENFANRIDNQ